MCLAATMVVGAAAGAAQEPTLKSVLEHAATYVEAYERQLSGVVAEESYTQSYAFTMTQFGNSRQTVRRELRSDVLLVRPAGADQYVQFRDVFEVDGRAVRDRQERLSRLFLAGSPTADAQMQRIKAESARFNIGDIERTINVPLLALMFLDPTYQPRFRFTRATERTPETLKDTSPGVDPSVAHFAVTVEMWVLEFEEIRTPTVIQTPTRRNMRATGRVWIDPGTGQVRMTKLIADNGDVRGVVDVSYDREARFGLVVPIAMRERYEGRTRGSVIEGAATYTAFRRFDVQVDENVGGAAR